MSTLTRTGGRALFALALVSLAPALSAQDEATRLAQSLIKLRGEV